MLILSPLEQFQILSLITIELFGFDFSITNALLVNIIALLCFSGTFYMFSSNKNCLKKSSFFFIPNPWQVIFESIYEVVSQLVFDLISTGSEKYFPFITIIFSFILFNNLIVLVPSSFTITSHLILTFTLPFSIFIGLNIICYQRHAVLELSGKTVKKATPHLGFLHRGTENLVTHVNCNRYFFKKHSINKNLECQKRFASTTPYKNKPIMEFLVPISVLLISVMCFLIYTSINDPYSIVVQILVFISIFILNLGIFCLYKSERKLSFIFFIVNCLLIFTYIRLSVSTTFPISLIYCATIFIGFHIFEETFTKRFFLRTRIILIGYYNNSEFTKIILWFFLVLIPSLIKHPIIIVSVYQPLMVYCYLFRYDYVLLFFFILIIWCGLLVLLNKYQIGLNFLEKCLAYFSRRACLHYVGNMVGDALRKMFNLINARSVASAVVTLVGVPNGLVILDYKNYLDDIGKTASQSAHDGYIKFCSDNKLSVDSYDDYHKRFIAYSEAVGKTRYGKYFLGLNLVGEPMPKGIDADTFKARFDAKNFAENFNLDGIANSFDDVQRTQADRREGIRQELLQANNRIDLFVLCERNLKSVAGQQNLTINYEVFKKIQEEHTSIELINYVMEEYRKADVAVLAQYKETYDQLKDQNTVVGYSNPVLSSKGVKFYSDMNLLDTTGEKELSQGDVMLQVELPETKVAAREVSGSALEAKLPESNPDLDLSRKRSIDESISTDTGESTSTSESKKLKK